MSRITDPTLLAIVENTSTGGLAMATAKAVFRVAHLLLAACDLNDVSALFETHVVKDRYVVQVTNKWGLSFVVGNFGPDDIQLEKLGKSWPAKTSHSSRRRRRVKP